MKFLRLTLLGRWGVSLVGAALIFSLGRPVFAQILETDLTLAQFVSVNNLTVGSEVGNNGFRQVYYVFNGAKTFITDSNYTNADPVIDREYIAWMGQTDGSWSIFLYHIPTGITTKLPSSPNNVNPRLSSGRVVWEGWVKDRWQVFLFDGVSVHQLTSGNLSIDPSINGDQVVYASVDEQNEQHVLTYSLGSKQVVTDADIAAELEGRTP